MRIEPFFASFLSLSCSHVCFFASTFGQAHVCHLLSPSCFLTPFAMAYIYPAELAVSEWFGKPIAATAKTQTEEELEVIAKEKEALTPPAINVAVHEADSWFNGRYDRLSNEGALDPKKKSVLLRGGRPQNDFKRGAHWFHESPFLPYGWGVESPKGASSLKQMSMRATVRDQSILTPDLFHNVPYSLAEYLWYSLGEW